MRKSGSFSGQTACGKTNRTVRFKDEFGPRNLLLRQVSAKSRSLAPLGMTYAPLLRDFEILNAKVRFSKLGK